MRPVPVPTDFGFWSRGTVVCAKWAPERSPPILAFGTSTGCLTLWSQESAGVQAVPLMAERFQRQVSTAEAVTCLNWSISATQIPLLAVGTNDGYIHLLLIQDAKDPKTIWSVECHPYVRPLQVGFPTVGRDEVLILGRDHGDIVLLGVKGNPLSSSAANAILSLETGDGAELVVQELAGAYRIHHYRHGKLAHIRELVTGQKGFPPANTRQVRSGDGGREVLIASDHGIIYVFDKLSGKIAFKLRLRSSSSSPAITAGTTPQWAFIASSGVYKGKGFINVWRRPRTAVSATDAVCLSVARKSTTEPMPKSGSRAVFFAILIWSAVGLLAFINVMLETFPAIKQWILQARFGAPQTASKARISWAKFMTEL
ncbi:hypothetical protein PUNSTDRAFT_137850 [Punctularia strigosozonata HHB-11173 SS5]|uniref:WD40 repeat-like protein n=1 Tax=Punctularia strigosozonata (strain HHB-11173) TaxID=741275 RepID=R7S4L0_PUNST|nr:uncharacterized protein PUNSTDRAFT_137850 [Punctularia strigosozonata HHB-11173 SS5]EIN05168.1 hypothetical protein PUNSTDRAFT_137850 [Punctularia strigosozonata HHB-11173 SS5]